LIRAVDSRWFGLADLACAVGSAVLVSVQPGLGGLSLSIAAWPWIVRLLSRRFPFKRTAFDVPLALFLITSAIGIWAAYNRAEAWAKFWVIVAAMFVYYALAGQPRENRWSAAGVLSALGAAIGLYFTLTNDWRAEPGDIGFLSRLGIWWMSARPSLPGGLHANIAGGLLILFLPFSVALLLHAWRERRLPVLIYAVVTGGVMAGCLLWTSSRGAWLASAAAFGVWGMWAVCAPMSARLKLSRQTLFLFAMAALIFLAAIGVALYPGGLVGLANRLPGFASGTTRWELDVNTYHLASAFPFTGGGLRAFEGLYSRYIMVITVPLFNYSHNFYMDLLMEHGVLGLMVTLWMLAVSVVRVIADPETGAPFTWLKWAALTALIAIALHGLIDDALNAKEGTPWLFVWAGMAVTMTRPVQIKLPVSGRLLSAAAIGVIVLMGALFYRSLTAALYANLGAVQMARAQLARWPEETGPGEMELAAASAWFHAAVEANPDNVAAQHRLGLLALRVGDYAQAQARLERAYQLSPHDRGVRKSLGYAYAWGGQVEEAVRLFSGLPEVPLELSTYAWWWGTQGRDDLSAYADQTYQRLQGDD
jgi:hypothetical protein